VSAPTEEEFTDTEMELQPLDPLDHEEKTGAVKKKKSMSQ